MTELVTAVLSSPDFLYRAISTSPMPDQARPLNDLELASRLSFFLWSEGPTRSCLNLATNKKLSDPKVMEAQVARMLKDPRANSLVENFALSWLNLDELEQVEPDDQSFNASMRLEFRNRDPALPLERAARKPQCAGPAQRELDVPERIARPAVRHSGRAGSAVPPRDAHERESLGPARQGCVPAAHVLRRPHVAGAARCVGARSAVGYAARPAAARRRHRSVGLCWATSRAPCASDSRTIATNLTCKGRHGLIDPPGLALENFSMSTAMLSKASICLRRHPRSMLGLHQLQQKCVRPHAGPGAACAAISTSSNT